MAISTIPLVLKAFSDKIKIKAPYVKVVFCPELTLEKGIRLLRAGNEQEDVAVDFGEAPLFMFNRSVIRPSQLPRVHRALKVDEVNYDAKEYKAVYGEFDLRYVLSSPDSGEVEAFEVDYLARDGVCDITEFDVDLTAYDLGQFTYTSEWQLLEDLRVESEGNYFKALSGSTIIRGYFFAFVGVSPVIQQINVDVKDWHEAVLSTFPVTV